MEASEKVILERLKNGDEQAFNIIYKKYSRNLTYKLLRLLKSDVLVEEVLQDLFLKIWDTRSTIDTNKSFGYYLYTIAHHSVIDIFRRANKEKEIILSIKQSNSESYDHIETLIHNKENKELLDALISQLPPKRRSIFIYCKLDGKTYQEAAEHFNVSKNTINDHIQKSSIFIKENLTSSKFGTLNLLLFYFFK